MAVSYTRYREKTLPPAPANGVVMGIMERRSKSTNALISTTSFKTGGSSLMISAQRCWDQVNKRSVPRRRRRRKIGVSKTYVWKDIPMLDPATGRQLFYEVDGEMLPVIRRKKIKVTEPIFERAESSLSLSTSDKGYRVGGPFLRVNIQLPHDSVIGPGTYRTVPEDSQSSYYLYRGGFGNPQFGSTDLISDSTYKSLGRTPGPTSYFPLLDSYGSQAFTRLRPQLEKAGLAVALREAKDIPGMLRTTAKGFHNIWKDLGGSQTSELMRPRSVADHYLNHQFGWVPFIKDLIQFHDVYQNSEKYIDQISRDNNSWIKRTRTLDTVEQITHVTQGGVTAGVEPSIHAFPYNMCRLQNVPGLGNCYGWYSIDEIQKSRVWATGRFKYYRPEFDRSLPDYSSQWNDLQRRLKIYGAELSPTNIWKSTPWTWLVDWFSNVGDQIDHANAIALDGSVCKYLYVMRHAYRQLVLTATYHYWQSQIVGQFIRNLETKQRQAAGSPFGFSLFGKDLSAKQWSILAALGISRSSIAMR